MNQPTRFAAGAVTLALAALSAPASSAEPINFQVRNNGDLLALCTTQPTNPNYLAAIHFCHGVGVGIVRYHESLTESSEFQPLFCLPKAGTRNQAIAEYVQYSKRHPEYNREGVGDVMIKFLMETYPCPAGSAAHAR